MKPWYDDPIFWVVAAGFALYFGACLLDYQAQMIAIHEKYHPSVARQQPICRKEPPGEKP